MHSSTPLVRDRVTFQVICVSLLLGMCLVGALAACVWWAVDRIDARSLLVERIAIQAALRQEMDRLPVEQDSFARGDDAALSVRANNQAWIAEYLTEGMSKVFGHDRVYVVAPDGQVVRAAVEGQYAGTTFAPVDAGVLPSRLALLRRQLVEASASPRGPTTAVEDVGVLEAERFANGDLAFISIRPIRPTSSSLTPSPDFQFLVASVKLVDQAMLDDISERSGIKDLRRVHYTKEKAALRIDGATGQTIAFLTWTPNAPAAGLLLETAPATIGLLLVGFSLLVALLVWLRTTSLKLQNSRGQTTYFALHDPLTGAANRILFDRKLREAISYQYLARTKILLVAIDLDHFKEINDTLGHAAGDRLLKEIAKRLMFELPEEATLGRLGGDEFAVVQPGIISEGQAVWICQRLLLALEKPFQIEDHPIEISVSLGIALEDGTTTASEEILRRADVALYIAKSEGRNRLKLYHPDMDQSRRDKRSLEVELRNALLNDAGLHVMYQPIFGARSGEIAGAEALVRWHHPTRGAMPPDQFIGLAEETGVIDQLGLWVLRRACQVALENDLPWVAVNVSPVQFRDVQLATRILDVVAQVGLTPDRLEVEIPKGCCCRIHPLSSKPLPPCAARVFGLPWTTSERVILPSAICAHTQWTSSRLINPSRVCSARTRPRRAS
jgi:diguanylate cyclase (GGDEF)-like protein